MSIVTATPTKLTVTRISPGDVVRFLPAIVAVSCLSATRDALIVAGSVEYHQSLSAVPLYATVLVVGVPPRMTILTVCDVAPVRSVMPSASSSTVIEPSAIPLSIACVIWVREPALPNTSLPLIAPPSASLVHVVDGRTAPLKFVRRWTCSNLHAPSQPSRFVRLPTSHCALPSTMPLPQLAPLGWHVPAAHMPPVPHAVPSCDESATA